MPNIFQSNAISLPILQEWCYKCIVDVHGSHMYSTSLFENVSLTLLLT